MASIRKVGRMAVGFVAVIGSWSSGCSGGGNKGVEGIPAKVWDGGGATLRVETENSSSANFSISFSEHGKETSRSLDTWAHVPAGSHSWSVDVPTGVGGYIELDGDNPRIGDRLNLIVRVNDKVVYQDADTLREPLPKGYGFFVQAFLDDYATGALGH